MKITILEQIIVGNKTENDEKVKSLMKDMEEMKTQSVRNENYIKKVEKETKRWGERLIKSKEETAKINKKLEEVEVKFEEAVKEVLVDTMKTFKEN